MHHYLGLSDTSTFCGILILFDHFFLLQFLIFQYLFRSLLEFVFCVFYSPLIILHLFTNRLCRYGTCDSKTPRISSIFLSTLTKPKFPHSLFFLFSNKFFFLYTYLIYLFLLPFNFILSSGNSYIYVLLHSLFRWPNPDHLHSS